MGLLLISVVISMIVACLGWVLAGDLLPLNEEVKWPSLQNIATYFALIVIPIYLIIFLIF